MYKPDTRVIDLTLGELLDAIEERMSQRQAGGQEQAATAPGKNYVYGLSGLAKLLGCSKTTASRLKASGTYDEAITQIGALVIIDADKVMEIAREKKH